ncbi:hypothetical protein LY76DRAFT_231677 [Colletotrichum caudatum]|nr:hypothetical protein LY76DRAFT_231677 [Colletotrichum caudatum]
MLGCSLTGRVGQLSFTLELCSHATQAFASLSPASVVLNPAADVIASQVRFQSMSSQAKRDASIQGYGRVCRPDHPSARLLYHFVYLPHCCGLWLRYQSLIDQQQPPKGLQKHPINQLKLP